MSCETVALTKEIIPELVLLERACFSAPWTEGMFCGELENDAAVYRIVLCEGVPVAYMGMWCVADEGQITNIAVEPKHRRKGLALGLLEEFISIAREKGLALLTLEVREHNEAAIRLYEKMGFVQVGRRQKYYENREDALLMTLFLDKQ